MAGTIKRAAGIAALWGALLPGSAVQAETWEHTIVVEADPLEKRYTAQESATGSRTSTSVLLTPQSLSVVGREEMNDRGVQTTTEALRYTPGVFTTTSAISTRADYFKIRGFDASFSGVLLDGLRTGSSLTFTRYQPWLMEQIDVLRGPNGFLYGAGSPGGTLNAVSKRPTRERHNEVGVQVGSFNRLQSQFDFSGPLDDDQTLLYRLVGIGRDSNTQYSQIPDNTAWFAPSFTWAPDDRLALTLLASIGRDEFGPSRPMIPAPGTLLDNPNGKIPRNQYLDGYKLDNHLDQSQISYIFDFQPDSVWSFHSSSRYSHNALMTQTVNGAGLMKDMRTLLRSNSLFEIKADVFATDNHVKKRWESGVLSGVGVLGASYRHVAQDFYRNDGPAAPVDIFSPRLSSAFSAPKPVVNNRQTAHETGVYAASDINIAGHVVLDLAGRYDWLDAITDDKLRGRTVKDNDDKFTWRLGATLLTDIGLAPYVSYATSFLPESGTDFYGKPFVPTTGKQVEGGIKYQPSGIDALLTAAWFRIEQDNVKTPDPQNNRNQIQIGQVRSEGVELSATANLTPSLAMLASYSWLDMTNTRSHIPGAQGKVPVGVPEQTASLWGDYTLVGGPLRGLGAGLGVRYVGKTWADSRNQIAVPSYTLLDAALHYEPGEVMPSLRGLRLSINASNLLNKHYYSTCSVRSQANSNCNEGSDRTILATLSYRW